MNTRALLRLAGVLLALSLLPALSSAGALSTSAACDGNQVVLSWSWTEDPSYPAGDPEWTGYDVYRQGMGECGPWIRVSASPYPRTMGASESFAFTETPPPGQAYAYRVMLVKSDRTEAPYPSTYDIGSNQIGYAGCPESQVPVVQGQLSNELGWTLLLIPCADTCYPMVYVMDYQALVDMAPYAGSTVRVFGTIGCGSVEGCFLSAVDHFDFAPCTLPTPAARTSWGRVKTLYR